MEAQDLRFFLDSGAFSAWSIGKVIDIDEYCAFIRANIEHLDVYASLDVIPGAPGRYATPQERDAAARQSWENYLYMKGEGLDPLPVYHYGEDPKWLENMLAYGCDYIGIGGLVGISSEMRQRWLDRVFATITDPEGRPIIKTHGFGMTSLPLIFRYPWYSVDSTSWIRVTQNGGVYLPRLDDDHNFRFDVSPETVFVSDRNPAQSLDGKHANSRGPSFRKLLDRWLKQCGVTYQQVEKDYYYRAVVNVTFFKLVSELRATQPFSNRTNLQGRFF